MTEAATTRRTQPAPTAGRDPLPARTVEGAFGQHEFEIVSRSLGGLTYTGSGVLSAMRLTQATRLVRPYAQSALIYACTEVCARAASGVPAQLFVSAEDDADEAPKENELERLLRRPNPIMSGRALWWMVSIFYQLSGGVAFFLNGRGRGGALGPIAPGEMPVEVWPVRYNACSPDLDPATKLPRAWRFGELEYPAHAVATIYKPDPDNLLRAFGPADAAWRAADHIYRAEAFDDALVENGGQIGGVFTHEEKRLDGKQAAALTDSIRKNAEQPQNNRKNVVLPAGIKFTPTTMTPRDMEAREFRDQKRDLILAVFGVPKTLLGYTEDANRASSRETRRSFYENTVQPYLEWLQDELIAHFFSKLPDQFREWSLGFLIDKTSAMREDVDAQIDRTRKLMGCGLSFADAAATVGLEHDVEGADERFIDTSLQPIEEALAPEEEEPDEMMEDEEAASVVAEVRRDVVDDELKMSARARRESALQAEEKRLAKHDRRIKKAITRVFDDYILAQIKRLRQVAEAGGGRSVNVRAWSWWSELPRWGANARAYASLLDYTPVEGSAGIVEVRGVTLDELELLMLGNAEKWGAELWSAVKNPIKETLEEAAKSAQRVVGGSLTTATDPAIVRFMAAKEVRIAEGPMTVVAERVKRAVIQGMTSSSPSVGTLADRVREALEELEDELRVLKDQLGTRAAMIARTESSSASNAARDAQFQSAGVAQSEWASAGDDLVRDQHAIDGELAVLGTPFSNGLLYPGDPSGAPGNIINCRCLALPVIPT